MLMKYMRGAEAISIFKPTDTLSTSFLTGWGWCGEVQRGDVERVGRSLFWGGFLFFFFSACKSPASQSDCENISMTEREDGREAARLVGDVNETAIHGCTQKQSRATAFPLCRYICLSPKSPRSTSQKVCHTSGLASCSVNINDSLAR